MLFTEENSGINASPLFIALEQICTASNEVAGLLQDVASFDHAEECQTMKQTMRTILDALIHHTSSITDATQADKRLVAAIQAYHDDLQKSREDLYKVISRHNKKSVARRMLSNITGNFETSRCAERIQHAHKVFSDLGITPPTSDPRDDAKLDLWAHLRDHI